MALRPHLLAPFLIAALGGCASTGTATPIALGQPVVMAPGERVALPEGASLRYVEVTDDSRCRPEVTCIRAGDANVVFEFTDAPASAQGVVLNTARLPATAPAGGWELRLLSLSFDAAPKARVQVDAHR